VKALPPNVVDKAIFVPFGGEEKSAHQISYLIPDVRLLVPERTINVVSSVNDLTAPGDIIFFDDISASGKQGTTALKQLFGAPLDGDDVEEEVIKKAKESSLDILRKSNVTFMFITGHRDGAQHVVEEARVLLNHSNVSSRVIVPSEFGCFQPAAKVFVDPEGARRAESIFSEKGTRALQDKKPAWTDEKIASRALGYGGKAGLIVFYYNVPSMTLTALWKECGLTDHRWMGLFIRRTAASVPLIQGALNLDAQPVQRPAETQPSAKERAKDQQKK
jgi:hypothetical protein